MIHESFTSFAHAGVKPVSRRLALRRLGSAGIVAASVPLAPMLAQAQTVTAVASMAEAWTAAWNSHDSAQVAAAAPDLHIKLAAGFGTDEWAAAEWIFSGTDTGGVAGTPTDKPFAVRGATIFALNNGKAVRDTDYYNAGTVREQLGLAPTTATPAS